MEEDKSAKPSSISALAHYESQSETGPAARKHSRLAFLRAFNNWVKSTLISRYSPKNSSVLDLCCGKGGDLGKWQRTHCKHYVGADISENLITLAVERVRKQALPFPAIFVKNADLLDPKLDIFAEIPAEIQFDVVSCQMAMHYLWETEATARNLLNVASKRLVPGGFFIGTLPDSRVLAQRLKLTKDHSFGNRFYRAVFDKDAADIEKETGFGIKYGFYLEDAVGQKESEGSIKLVPEYVVSMERLALMAGKEFGLEWKGGQNFSDFYDENSWDRAAWDVYCKMVRRHEIEPYVEEQWETVKLYTTFVFQKTGAKAAHNIGLGDCGQKSPSILVLDANKKAV